MRAKCIVVMVIHRSRLWRLVASWMVMMKLGMRGVVMVVPILMAGYVRMRLRSKHANMTQSIRGVVVVHHRESSSCSEWLRFRVRLLNLIHLE